MNTVSILAILISTCATAIAAETQPTSQSAGLEVLDVRLEPVQQGTNVLHVKVRNDGATEKTFGIHIGTESPDYGPNGMGWGTNFYESIPAGQERDCRFAYKIEGPLTDDTSVRLSFYALASPEAYTNESVPFGKRQYVAKELERRQFAPPTPASEADTQAARVALSKLQELLAAGKYADAFESFTPDYQRAEFQETGLKVFERAMSDPAWGALFSLGQGQTAGAGAAIRPSEGGMNGSCRRRAAGRHGLSRWYGLAGA